MEHISMIGPAPRSPSDQPWTWLHQGLKWWSATSRAKSSRALVALSPSPVQRFTRPLGLGDDADEGPRGPPFKGVICNIDSKKCDSELYYNIYISYISLSPSLYAMFNHMSSRSWTGLWAGLRRKLSNDQRDQFIEDYFSVNGLGCLVCKMVSLTLADSVPTSRMQNEPQHQRALQQNSTNSWTTWEYVEFGSLWPFN